jgi:trans-AT polyketide synthase/acyltransferase/oxidoreductase domain-containing protein
VNLVVRSTSVPIAERCNPMIRSPSQCPGTARSADSAGRRARRGLFFPARANKLYELYQRHESLDQIDQATMRLIEERYFQRSFEDVWNETRDHYRKIDPDALAVIERSPKRKMALIFRWYFVHATRLAMRGAEGRRVDYQVHCGPALGAFNQWVKGTELKPWRNRHVADLAERIMCGAAKLLTDRFAALVGQPA